MANIFIDGKLGEFDETNDPNGNPPADWNVSKDALAVLGFDSENKIEGLGSFSFSTKSIFNDNYAFNLFGSGAAVFEGDCDVDTTSPFSIEFRVARNGGTITYFRFKDNSGNTVFRFFQNGTESIGYAFRFLWPDNGGVNRAVSTARSFPDGNTYSHVVVRCDVNNQFQLFIDGSSVDIENVNNNFNYSKVDKLIIDADTINDSGNILRGLRIYDKYLTDTEIASLYNGESKVIQPIPATALNNIIHEVLFNQEQGTEINETINNKHLVPNEEVFNEDLYNFDGGVWLDVS